MKKIIKNPQYDSDDDSQGEWAIDINNFCYILFHENRWDKLIIDQAMNSNQVSIE